MLSLYSVEFTTLAILNIVITILNTNNNLCTMSEFLIISRYHFLLYQTVYQTKVQDNFYYES